MLIHSHLPYDPSTSHARIPAGGIHLIASIGSASDEQVTASFFGSTKALHGENAIPSAETTTHNHSNQQYSVTAVTTSTGSVAERYAYSAYGEPSILDGSGSVLASSAISNRYSYTGREWDATVGLHHFRARWMSPKTGRFLSRDPIGFEGSEWNFYQYVGSQALNLYDPSGECPCDHKGCKLKGIPTGPTATANCGTMDRGGNAIGFTFESNFSFDKDACCECCVFRQYLPQWELRFYKERQMVSSYDLKKHFNTEEEDCTIIRDDKTGLPKRVCYGDRGASGGASNIYGDCTYHMDDTPYVTTKVLKELAKAAKPGKWDKICIYYHFRQYIKDNCLGGTVWGGDLFKQCCISKNDLFSL